MNEPQKPMQVTTQQAHDNLKGLLLNGRVLINGLPLTVNELAALLHGEQMLYEKAMQFDKASELAAKNAKIGKKEIPKKELNINGTDLQKPAKG